MYIPAAFAETDLATLHAFIEQHSFGLLVSQVDERPFATHLPFLLDREAGSRGRLIGHVARANPQWRDLSAQTVLAVFSGPHAYISPTWYQAEDVVPTWNFTAVHAYGRVQVVEDESGLLDIVRKLTDVFERSLPQPWRFDSSSTFRQRMLAQIVGFRIEIETIEGKWKLSQNQPVERRENVIRALQEQSGENAAAVAEMMQHILPAER